MRVCLVSQEFPQGYTGGIGTQTRVKARGLAALGHAVEVLTIGAAGAAELETAEDEGIRVHRMRQPGEDFEVRGTESYWLGHSWTVLASLRRLTERDGAFDVIDFPDYGAEGFAYALDRDELERAALVVHLHGSLGMFAERIGWPEHGSSLHTVGTFMEDLVIERADALIAASASIAALTAARLGLPAERIESVEGAVDVELFSPPEASRPDTGRLLFVGSLAANKGSGTVLEAFAALAAERPELSLTLVGDGDEERERELRERIEGAGLGDRARLTGFVEHAELPDLYRDADLFVAPSQYEGGLGMVYLEAMASGVPVIARAAGGATEAVAHGETGLLLERGDVAETVAAIEALLSRGDVRRRMAEAGRRRVVEMFGPARYAERVAAAYERAIARRREALAEDAG